MLIILSFSSFFFFNDTATTEIYTLSLHDALPISPPKQIMDWFRIIGNRSGENRPRMTRIRRINTGLIRANPSHPRDPRSEEHTSELQSQSNLVCRLLLEKKKKITNQPRDTDSEHR